MAANNINNNTHKINLIHGEKSSVREISGLIDAPDAINFKPNSEGLAETRLSADGNHSVNLFKQVTYDLTLKLLYGVDSILFLSKKYQKQLTDEGSDIFSVSIVERKTGSLIHTIVNVAIVSDYEFQKNVDPVFILRGVLQS